MNPFKYRRPLPEEDDGAAWHHHEMLALQWLEEHGQPQPPPHPIPEEP